MRLAYADQLAVGLAGEHIACADLLALGFAPFRTEQGAAYDIGVDIGSARILRLQVKATTGPRRYLQERQQHVTGYCWTMRRGKKGVRSYGAAEIDGFALVALDRRLVAYVKPPLQTLQIAVTGSRQAHPRGFADFPFEGLL